MLDTYAMLNDATTLLLIMFNDLTYKTLLPSKKPKSNVEVKDENGE